MEQTHLPLLPIWVQYLQALGPAFVALVVGIIAVSIAYWQSKTTWNKLRLDLYDKRFGIYEATREFHRSCVFGGATINNQAYANMQNAMDQSRFLFGHAFHLKLQALYDDHIDYENAYKLGDGARIKASDAIRKLNEDHNLEKLFAPYLSFAHIS